jgi:hypothetical protein
MQKGDVIRYRYRGSWEYRTLTSDDGEGTVSDIPPAGTVKVIEGVWKRDVFHERKTINWNSCRMKP